MAAGNRSEQGLEIERVVSVFVEGDGCSVLKLVSGAEEKWWNCNGS